MTDPRTDRRTDAELLADHRHSDGDDRAFAELVRRNVGWVHGAARRRLRDSHLADDVAQAVFILLHRKGPPFSSDRALVAWLHRTTWYASEVADRSRRRQRRHEIEAFMLRSTDSQPVAAREHDKQWDELAPLLDRLIERLGRRDREAVLLRFYRQMTFAEVAAATETTEEAARKRVDRALEKLRGWAAREGVAVASAASIESGMASEAVGVASAAPAGVVAMATGAALAVRGSAVTLPSIPIAKGAITMMAWTKAKLVAGVALAVLVTTAGGVALIAATAASSPSLRPHPRQLAEAPAASQPGQPGRPSYDRLSPYDAIRWKDDDTPEIHVAGAWYSWLAIDEDDVAKIIEFTRNTYKPREVKMRIGEDLVEVLTKMGNPPGPLVNLKVRKLDSGETVDLNDVPMTHENRQKVFKARLEQEKK
jgi:RNA polymerase sigma factor (sigma-70 family)